MNELELFYSLDAKYDEYDSFTFKQHYRDGRFIVTVYYLGIRILDYDGKISYVLCYILGELEYIYVVHTIAKILNVNISMVKHLLIYDNE